MQTLTVRITVNDHSILSHMSKQSGESLTTLLGKAVRLLKAQETLRQLDEDYSRLKARPRAWEAFRNEIQSYESIFSDGLEPEEWSDADFLTVDRSRSRT